MAKRWEAVEHEDGNECGPCNAIDGTLYRNREDAYADYPGGVGYKDCVGAKYGNACRGKVVKRRGAERSDQGMTDTRLLNNFRALLTERAAFMAKQKPVARALKPGQDWFSIKNVSADEASIHIFDEIGFWGTTVQSMVDQLNAMCMLHDASGMTWGNATTHRAQADLLDKLSMNIADMYALQAGGTQSEWFARMENTETWYTGEEALKAGLADEMTDPDEPDEKDDSVMSESNRLSVAVFNYAGRAQAPAPDVSRETVPAVVQHYLIEDSSSEDKAQDMLAFLAERIRSGKGQA